MTIDRWTEAIAAALAHSLWQFAVIALVFQLALRIMPGTRAPSRKCATVFALSGATRKNYSATRHGFGVLSLLAMVIVFALTINIHLQAGSSVGAMPTAAIPEGTGAWRKIVVTLWAAGATISIAIIFVFGGRHLTALRRTASALPQNLADTLAPFAGRMAGTRKIAILQSDQIDVPCTFGFLRPIILLPMALMTHLTPRELEAVIAHEIAHIRRFDAITLWFQRAITGVFFYHPAVWIISAQTSVWRERACDDWAAAQTGDPTALARALGRCALYQNRGRSAFAPAFTGADITERMRRLLNWETPPSARSRRLGAAAFMMIIGVCGVMLSSAREPAMAQIDTASLRDNLCNQVRRDGYYHDPSFTTDFYVDAHFTDGRVTLNGRALNASEARRYQRIIAQHRLHPNGLLIRFNGRGSEISIRRKADDQRIAMRTANRSIF